MRFLDYFENPLKTQELQSYQYPSPTLAQPPFAVILHQDPSRSFVDLNTTGDSNQFAHFCQIVTRLFLLRFHEGDTNETPSSPPVSELLRKYKQKIFEGKKFCFDDFNTPEVANNKTNKKDNLTPTEKQHHMQQMLHICEELCRLLGGKIITSDKIRATHWVFYTREPSFCSFSTDKISKVHFSYITECFVALLELDPTPWFIRP
jgi:hypothetical protein